MNLYYLIILICNEYPVLNSLVQTAKSVFPTPQKSEHRYAVRMRNAPLGSRRDMPSSGHTTGGEFFCLDGVFHSIHDLCSLRVIETLHRADKVPGDAPDTLELHALARLPAFNAESIPRPA